MKQLFGRTDELCKNLTNEEKRRADERKQRDDRDRHVAALALLSMLYAYRNGELAAETEAEMDIGEERVKILSFSSLEMLPLPQIFITERGKPHFADTEPHFSLSHSHGVIFAALSDVPVGADVELADEKKDTDRIASRFFSVSEQKEDFFGVWTKKEAYAKLTGEGVCSVRALDTTACDASFLTLPYTDGEGKKYSASITIKNKEI